MRHRIFIPALLLVPALFSAGASTANVNPDGSVELPYHEDFGTEDNLGLIDIIDANNDGRTWVWSDIVYDMRNKASEEQDADDWMILPPMEMKADKSYRLTFSARAVYSMYTERLEVKLSKGAQASPAAMSVTLVPATDIVKRSETGVTVTVPEDGIYRIGFHAISQAGAFRLAIDDITVDTPRSALRPGEPTGCHADMVSEGMLKADVSFSAPEYTVNGKPLGQIDKIRLLVNGDLAEEISAPSPGERFTRRVETVQGENIFRIAAVNSEGEGEPAEISLFTGDDVPLSPSNLRMEVKDGKAHLQWDAPTEGENGGFIDPATLTYEIQRRSDFQYVETSFSDTEYVDVLPDNIDSRPRQLFYCVRAISHGGKSLYSADSNRFITGYSIPIPFSESFAGLNYDDDHYWHSINYGERWNLDNTLVFDNDGGAAKFAPANMDENSLFYTSRIDLRGNAHPLLTFHYWHVKNSDMILEVMVSRENGEFRTVRTIDFTDDGDLTGWKKCAVLLDGYTDAEYVLIGWKGTAGGVKAVTAIDAIDLRDVLSADLSVSLSAPEKAAENQPVRMAVTVANIGATDATDFKVTLKHEGLGTVMEQSCECLAVGMTHEFEFNLSFHCTPGITNGAYTASVIWDKDINFTNDIDRKVVQLRPGRLPKPAGLKGGRSSGCVVLSWDEPALSGRITDDIEDYTPFAISDFGDWITIDRDRQDTYRIVEGKIDEDGEQLGFVTLEYPNAGASMAFQVFNPFEAGSSLAEGMCRSGNQVLASFAAVRDRNDDWLISPELSGEAQTVSFWARSGGDPSFGREKLEVYCSPELQEPEKFTQVAGETSVPNNEWMEISVDVPAGTKHFAIHCISEIVMVLFIDDISFIPKPAEATLIGYNVFKDGKKLNGAPVKERSYVDQGIEESAVYHVTALYAEGESMPTARIAVSEMGESATESVAEESYLLTIGSGCIEISSRRNIDIHILTIAGETVAQREISGVWRFNLSKGVYIVLVDGKAEKIIVS